MTTCNTSSLISCPTLISSLYSKNCRKNFNSIASLSIGSASVRNTAFQPCKQNPNFSFLNRMPFHFFQVAKRPLKNQYRTYHFPPCSVSESSMSSALGAETADEEDDPTAELSYFDPEVDPLSISEWELDFCSRPILDIRGKKIWELVVCDDSHSLQYTKYFPNDVINSVTLENALVSICDELDVPLVHFFSIIDATCLASEKQALVEIKKQLKDPSGRLSSWIDHHVDCCKWEGVVCSNKSGNVIQLHLQNPGGIVDSFSHPGMGDPKSALSGKISHSLLNLTQLHYLDLSLNDFKGIPIPSFLGSLKSLRYLNLSLAGFQGTVPYQLGNLSSLRTLSIHGQYSYGFWLQVDNLQWLAGLSNLEHLDMIGVNLSTASNWLEVMNMIPSLVELHLTSCNLIQISQLIHANFSSLTILDLSFNSFRSFLPIWIFGLNALVSLDLRGNRFETPWPGGPWNLTSLNHLDLSWNQLNGSLPRELFNLNNLISLNLRENTLEDSSSPSGNWNWSSLKSLDLSFNNFNWFLPNILLTLSGLISLDLSYNSLQGSIPSTIANISSLQYLGLSHNDLNSSLPNAQFTFDDLTELDLSYNQFNGPIPSTIGNSTKLKYLDLSENNLNLSMNKWLYNCTSLESLLLSNNQLQGEILDDIVQLGKFEKLRVLDLSYNALSSSIPLDLGRLSSLVNLLIIESKLTGTLPESLGQLSKLEVLSISYNLMEGIVTGSLFENLTNLKYFYASGNSLTLKVSASWIPRAQFKGLGLGSWNLGSKFPTWLQSQKYIKYLDLSSTGISGTIPSWFWNLSMPLWNLNLSHNQLQGEIPNVSGIGEIDLNSNQSGSVWSLDLSNNLFSGDISHFLCDIKNEDQNLVYLYLDHNFLSGEIPDCWKNWPYLGIISLNNNNFTGSIPRSMINLEYLWELHLRNNSLSGQIPLT